MLRQKSRIIGMPFELELFKLLCFLGLALSMPKGLSATLISLWFTVQTYLFPSFPFPQWLLFYSVFSLRSFTYI
jgi:hypothetical protein